MEDAEFIYSSYTRRRASESLMCLVAGHHKIEYELWGLVLWFKLDVSSTENEVLSSLS